MRKNSKNLGKNTRWFRLYNNNASLGSEFEQYILLAWLTDAEAQSKTLDNAMIINEPAKPVAGSCRHPDDEDIVDGELRY